MRDENAAVAKAGEAAGGVFVPTATRPAEHIIWNLAVPGSSEAATGPHGRWWVFEWRKGDRLATLKLGLMTSHEARATPGIRGDGWHQVQAMGLCVVFGLEF